MVTDGLCWVPGSGLWGNNNSDSLFQIIMENDSAAYIGDVFYIFSDSNSYFYDNLAYQYLS